MTTSLLEKKRELCSQNLLMQARSKKIKGKTKERTRDGHVASVTENTTISNKDIFQILLQTSLELGLSESEQFELLSYLNAFNEIL